MTWSANIEDIEPKRVVRVSLSKRGERLSHGEVIDALTKDSDFRQIYNKAIADAPYEALFWEWPPITLSTADRPNEYVLVRSPTLAGVRADPNAFAEHFTGPRAVTFENLGGDAVLVAPSPGPQTARCAHLAAFARCPDDERQQAFWRSVGEAIRDAICDTPRWLSTSGLGIYWLHARIDTRPKYYTHAPYRNASFY